MKNNFYEIYFELLKKVQEIVSDRYDAYPRMGRIGRHSESHDALEICSRGYNIYLFCKQKRQAEEGKFDYLVVDCYGKGLREEGKINLDELTLFLDKRCNGKPLERTLW